MRKRTKKILIAFLICTIKLVSVMYSCISVAVLAVGLMIQTCYLIIWGNDVLSNELSIFIVLPLYAFITLKKIITC